MTSWTLAPWPVPKLSLAMAARFELFQRRHVGRGQIVDVDVIANAGAVGGGIVVAENLDTLALSQRHLQHQRNQMRFRVVVFANRAVGAAPEALK